MKNNITTKNTVLKSKRQEQARSSSADPPSATFRGAYLHRAVCPTRHLPEASPRQQKTGSLICFVRACLAVLLFGLRLLVNAMLGTWNLMRQDLDIDLRSSCVDSSSPQISAILVGHSYCEQMMASAILRKTSARAARFWARKIS